MEILPKEILSKLDFIKIKTYTVQKMMPRRQKGTVKKKIFVKDTTKKGISSKIDDKFIKLNNKKTNNSITTWAKDLS